MDKKKTKVAFMIDSIARGTAGTEKQLIRTIEMIDRNMIEPYMICLRESPWMERNILPCPVKFVGYRGFLKRNIFHVFAELRRFVREEGIHVVHVFFRESIFVAYLAWPTGREGYPVLLSSRRDIGLGDEPWYHVLYDFLLPFINRRFKAVVANSRNVKNHVIEKERLREGTIRIIYNGVDVKMESRKRTQQSALYSKEINIGIVASLKKVKRVDLFLEAFRTVRESVEGIHLGGLILGDGPEKASLVQMAVSLGIEKDVFFAGEVADVNSYLRNVDIGVSCSDREGLSNAILEYMSCGLPIVATEVGGTTELVDATNGICVPPDDPSALAEALRNLVIAPEIRRSMGARSLEKARSQFSWERNISELELLYRELLLDHAEWNRVTGGTPLVNG
jgi:glycosyltransferase involved in cell wall biosynthesis